MTRIARTGWAVALVAAGSFGVASMAAGPEADPIKARQEAMEDVGKAMKALAAIAKNEAPFDASVVQKSAGTIADRLQKVAPLFPAGSDKGSLETWAKPEVWSDHATFEKSRESARAAAVALQAVTEESGFRPAMGQLGQNCKACHDKFRRPKS